MSCQKRERVGTALFPDPVLAQNCPQAEITSVDDDGELVPPSRLPLWRYAFADAEGLVTAHVTVAAHDALPPSDAVGLLLGEDNTGMILWSGSEAIAQFIFSEITGRRISANSVIVELGCGAAIASVAAACAASCAAQRNLTIFATDGNDDCVALASDNLHRNMLTFDAQSRCDAFAVPYRWGEAIPRTLMDVLSFGREGGDTIILGGDLLYHRDAIQPLTDALCDLARVASLGSRRVRFVFAFFRRTWTEGESRAMHADFSAALKRRGWAQQQTHTDCDGIITEYTFLEPV
jgi:predicted nicotinamide N-methyase